MSSDNRAEGRALQAVLDERVIQELAVVQTESLGAGEVERAWSCGWVHSDPVGHCRSTRQKKRMRQLLMLMSVKRTYTSSGNLRSISHSGLFGFPTPSIPSSPALLLVRLPLYMLAIVPSPVRPASSSSSLKKLCSGGSSSMTSLALRLRGIGGAYDGLSASVVDDEGRRVDVKTRRAAVQRPDTPSTND